MHLNWQMILQPKVPENTMNFGMSGQIRYSFCPVVINLSVVLITDNVFGETRHLFLGVFLFLKKSWVIKRTNFIGTRQK
jgi:hypothetical protein